jgi:hypothetical protein
MRADQLGNGHQHIHWPSPQPEQLPPYEAPVPLGKPQTRTPPIWQLHPAPATRSYDAQGHHHPAKRQCGTPYTHPRNGCAQYHPTSSTHQARPHCDHTRPAQPICTPFGRTQPMGHPPPPPLPLSFTHTPAIQTCKTGLAHLYPTNAPSHNHPVSKSAPSSPFGIFETVWHPHGIGPNKPVIRVPAQTKMAKSTYLALSDQDIVKSTPPSHPAAPIQCLCGQLVPVSSNQMFRSISSHHTLSSFISRFFSLPVSFPRQFFPHFTFS